MANNFTEGDILKLYKKGLSVIKISTMQKNLKTSRIYYVLRKNKIVIRGKNDISTEMLLNIKRDYKKLSLLKLSKKYNIEKTFLCRLLNSQKISETVIKLILILHRKKTTPSRIAQHCNLTTKAVKKVIQEREPVNNTCSNILKNVGLTKEEVLAFRNKVIKKTLKENFNKS